MNCKLNAFLLLIYLLTYCPNSLIAQCGTQMPLEQSLSADVPPPPLCFEGLESADELPIVSVKINIHYHELFPGV